MFDILCSDLVNHIFGYDSTYKDVFKNVLNDLVTPRMRAVYFFLSNCQIMEDEWKFEKMTQLHVNTGIGVPFVEIRYNSNTRMAFYVMTEDEKYMLDIPGFADSTLIVKDFLHHLPISTLSPYVSCSPELIREWLDEYTFADDPDPSCCNQKIYNALGKDGYQKLVHHLIDIGSYNSFVHRFVFKKLFSEIDEMYFIEDSENYRYVRYNGQTYIIYWNVYTSTLFM